MCLFPQRAEVIQGKKPFITPEGSLQLPCGKCTECIKKRAIEWATRARHEMSLHSENSYLTLTFNEEKLPSSIDDVKHEFQKFIKRIRKTYQLRYMVSYEYGSQKFRPHCHAIVFGYSPPDQKYLKKTTGGHSLFTSKELDKKWPFGFHSIGEANERTAYYIASYALKGKSHTIMLPDGEEVIVKDEMQASRNPAIGLEYLKQNYIQLINSGEPLPRYYQKKLAGIDETALMHYESLMQEKLKTRSPQELLAKYCIDQQKLDQSDSEYRKIDLDEKQRVGLKNYLTTNRDDFVSNKGR